MQRVLQMLETRDAVHVAELSEAFSVSEVTIRSDLAELARQGLVARVRGGVRPLQRSQAELGFDFRLAARRAGQAGDRAGRRGNGRRGRGRRARCEHDGVLPGARAALQARARGRHERAARGGVARRRAGDQRARHRRRAAPLRDVARRRSRRRAAARNALQVGLPRRARPQRRARADGSQPRRGADQAGDGRRLRARRLHRRRDEVAAQRTALVRAAGRGARDRHRRRARPTDQIEAWRARGVEVVVAEVAESVRAPLQLVDLRPRPPFEEREH